MPKLAHGGHRGDTQIATIHIVDHHGDEEQDYRGPPSRVRDRCLDGILASSDRLRTHRAVAGEAGFSRYKREFDRFFSNTEQGARPRCWSSPENDKRRRTARQEMLVRYGESFDLGSPLSLGHRRPEQHGAH